MKTRLPTRTGLVFGVTEVLNADSVLLDIENAGQYSGSFRALPGGNPVSQNANGDFDNLMKVFPQPSAFTSLAGVAVSGIAPRRLRPAV